MSALTESRKRDASAFLADNDRLISKRMRRGVRLFSPPPPPPSISNPLVPDYSPVNSEGTVINGFFLGDPTPTQVLVTKPTFYGLGSINSKEIQLCRQYGFNFYPSIKLWQHFLHVLLFFYQFQLSFLRIPSMHYINCTQLDTS